MDTPRVLLEHYLKQLRLPTMVREYPKLAEQCAKEGVTFEQFLLRLVEQEMMDRERAGDRAAHQSGEVSGEQEPGDLRFSRPPLAEQEAGGGAGAVRVDRPAGERAGSGQQRYGEDPHRPGVGTGGLPAGISRAVHHRGVAGA
jgi:IstB-like ATP binding protein